MTVRPSPTRRTSPILQLVALLGLAGAPGRVVGQDRPPPGREPDRVEGPETEALEAVDGFLRTFNSGDQDGVIASFAPNASVSRFNWLVEEFLRDDLAAPDYYTWMLGTNPWEYRIEVLDRVASGSFVFQRERLVVRGPNGQEGTQTHAVLYGVREGRIQSIRPLPDEIDPGAVPAVDGPRFRRGEGPVVALDVAHFNHHKPELSYRPFVELLRREGYVTHSWPSEFRKAALDSAGVDVLVIANATAEKNAREPVGGWRLPTPSAFTSTEVAELESWVRSGGSLLLVADHLPWGGAAAALAAAFGVEFQNGFARDTSFSPPDVFRRLDGTLRSHPITEGLVGGARVDSVTTFTGQAFRPFDVDDTGLEPILVLSDSWVLVQPEASGQVTNDTPRIPVSGWWQGAAGTHGDGRVALFGEAAMFRVLTEAAGLPAGQQNARLTRNVIAWLSSAR